MHPKFVISNKSKLKQRRPNRRKKASWTRLPYPALVEIYRNLPDSDRVATAKVCRTWNKAFRNPTLWRSRHFLLGGPRAKVTGQRVIKFAESLGSYMHRVRITCEHMTSNTCETITGTLEPFAKSIEDAKLEIIEIKGLELDRFWKHAQLRGKVQECLIKLIKSQHNLKTFELTSAQFSVSAGMELLDVLATVCAPKLHTVRLEGFFHCRLPLNQTAVFRNIMKKFTNLSEVSLNFCCLSDELLRHWSSCLKGRLQHLRIKACCDGERRDHTLQDKSWAALTMTCPRLTVEMSVVGISPASAIIPILAPSLPLTSLDIWSGYDTDFELQLSALLNDITNKYHRRLQHLGIDFDNFHDNIDEALINMIFRCKNLTSLRIKANASIQVASAIYHFVKRRHTRLTNVSITLCDMSDPDIEQLRDLQHEIQPFVDARGINFMLHDNLF